MSFFERSKSVSYMNNIKIYFALFLLLLTPFAEGGSIYKWVDEQGVTHYSSATPADKKAEQLKTQAAPPVVEDRSPQQSMKDWQANEQFKNYKQKREQQEAAENKLREENAEKARRCAIAKERLGILQQQRRLYSTNDQGEREYLDDDARAAETKRMQEAVANNC